MSARAKSATELLRPGLLTGVAVLLAGAREGPAEDAFAGEAARACAALGASVSSCVGLEGSAAADAPGDAEEAADDAVRTTVEEIGGIDVLVVDGAGLFAGGDAGGGSTHTALRACVDGAWNATRAVVNHAFLADGGHRGRDPGRPTGRILYIAPRPGAGAHADAACAGLENLARTLSIEWARYAITTAAIAPGAATAAGEVAALAAYLASPAGAYFSGCLLDLRGP